MLHEKDLFYYLTVDERSEYWKNAYLETIEPENWFYFYQMQEDLIRKASRRKQDHFM